MEIVLTNPASLWFLLAVPLIIVSHFYSLRIARGKALKFANFEALSRVSLSQRISRNWTLLAARIVIVVSIVLALCGPVAWYQGLTTGMEYVIAIDASGSMFATDFLPNRIDAAKYSASLFIKGLSGGSPVGVVSFSGNAFIEEPLTEDMSSAIEAVNLIIVRKSSGTAIGDAIITSTNLFDHNSGKGKVLVLLTDGQNTVGTVLEEAIEYANNRGVAVYTVGVGTQEGGNFGALDAVSKLDSDELTEIARRTGGVFYLSSDRGQLINAFKEITQKKKQKIKLEISYALIVFALLAILVEWGLLNTVYKGVP